MVKLGELLKVTRDDIQDFPGDTIQLIMDLQKEGWRAQRSNRNHVILLAPDGVTKYSASRNANSAKYLSQDIAKYKRGETMHGEPENIEELTKEAKEEMATTLKFKCPQADCPQQFISQEKVNVHVAVDHEGYLKCPDCDEVRVNNRALSQHRSRKHGYVSPRYKRRKELEAEKAKVVEEVTERLDEDPVNRINASDGTKFDEKFLEDHLQSYDGKPVLDAMDIHHITKGEVDAGLKGLVSSVTEFDPPLEFNQYVQAPEGRLSNAEIYRQTRNQLVAGVDPEVVRTADLEFIDSRDSWVLDHYDITERRIGTLEQILDAAGLRMEIRVWKPKD